MQTLYDTIGTHYSNYRRPDPRIASALHAELGQALSIVNLGAGVGSYEPRDQARVAVEPSCVMISQRAKRGLPVVQARAESLPFRDAAFDVATAILTIHHWADIERGLLEARRSPAGTLDSSRPCALGWGWSGLRGTESARSVSGLVQCSGDRAPTPYHLPKGGSGVGQVLLHPRSVCFVRQLLADLGGDRCHRSVGRLQ